MKKVQNLALFFGALILLGGQIFAQEKQLPAIHFSSTDIEDVGEVQPETKAQPESEAQPEKKAQSELEAQPESETQPETVAKPESEVQPESTAESHQPYEQPVETVAFNGITPSKTTVKELHEMLGEPVKVQKNGMGEGIDVEEYKIDGFKGVDFHIMNGKVFGVIAEFTESVNARKLAADLGMEHIQSVFLTNEKGVIQGEIFPEIGVAYAYDPSQKLGTIEEMQKDPQSIPMNVIQLIFQPVGPDPFLLRAETWVDIDQKRAYKDVLQALKLDPENKRALGYKKVLEEAVPSLKDEVKLSDDAPKADESKKDDSMLEMLTPPPLESISEDAGELKDPDETSKEKTESDEKDSGELKLEDASEIGELDVPSVESLMEDVGDGKSGEKTEEADANELPLTLDSDELEEETKQAPKEDSQKETETKSETKPSAENADGSGSLRPLNDEETGSSLELPQELSDDLAKLNEPGSEKQMLPSNEQPVLTFEDELFQKVENLAQNGKIQEAQELLMEIRKRFIDNPFISFRANLVEGDILMILPTPDAEGAFNCHRIASEQGEKLLNGKVYRGRKYPLTKDEKRRVKLFLLDVWLGAAGDLVLNRANEEKNYGKWLEKVVVTMTELVPENVDDFSWSDANLCYRISYRMLSILLEGGNDQEIAEEAKRHLAITMKMLSLSKNSTEYFSICLKTSLLLDDASTIMISKEHFKNAEEYLDRGIKFMEQVKSHRDKVMTDEEFLLAQLYYHRGQVIVLSAAKLAEDEKIQAHQEAVEWYEKALPVLLEVIKTKQWQDLLQLGKIMNGMSVSYAKLGNSQKAVILLKTGIFCLEQHVDSNPRDAAQLQVLYKNIIRILKFLNQNEEAQVYQRKMEGLNF
ncbi:MAG: hypothetical protein K6C40_02660 [Thermoguttaceae bacterium]|nr:hypothetical protein [Thermoguttaceae bacterium]